MKMKLSDCAVAVAARRPFMGSNCWGERTENGYVVWCNVTTHLRGRDQDSEWPVAIFRHNQAAGIGEWVTVNRGSVYSTTGRDQKRIKTILAHLPHNLCPTAMLATLQEVAHTVVHGEAAAKWSDL